MLLWQLTLSQRSFTKYQIIDLRRRCCNYWLCCKAALQSIKGCCDCWHYFHHKYTKCKGCCGCWRLRWAHVSCKSTWFWLLTIYEVQIIHLQRRCCDSWLRYTSALQNIKHRCDCWRYFHHKYTKCKGCCGCCVFFALSVARPRAKKLSASGGFYSWPAEKGLCRWSPLEALPPDPRYRLALHALAMCPPPKTAHGPPCSSTLALALGGMHQCPPLATPHALTNIKGCCNCLRYSHHKYTIGKGCWVLTSTLGLCTM